MLRNTLTACLHRYEQHSTMPNWVVKWTPTSYPCQYPPCFALRRLLPLALNVCFQNRPTSALGRLPPYIQRTTRCEPRLLFRDQSSNRLARARSAAMRIGQGLQRVYLLLERIDARELAVEAQLRRRQALICRLRAQSGQGRCGDRGRNSRVFSKPTRLRGHGVSRMFTSPAAARWWCSARPDSWCRNAGPVRRRPAGARTGR